MKTIVDINTEEVLYSTIVEIELQDNEMLVDGGSGEFTHYSIKDKQFYNKEI